VITKPKDKPDGRKRSKSSPNPKWQQKPEILADSSRPTFTLHHKYDPSIPFVPIRQPKGPDGTKGFSIGRGIVLTART